MIPLILSVRFFICRRSDIEIKNASNAQQLYSDIVNWNHPPNTSNTCQQLYSDIKNSSHASHGQQLLNDFKNASKAQQQLFVDSDIENSSKQLQEKWLQEMLFLSALAMCLNLMIMIYRVCSLLNDTILLKRFLHLNP